MHQRSYIKFTHNIHVNFEKIKKDLLELIFTFQSIYIRYLLLVTKFKNIYIVAFKSFLMMPNAVYPSNPQ